MIWLVVGSLLPSLAVSALACWIIRRRAPRWGLVDRPGKRKVHTQPVPLGGGLAIWLAVVVPLAAGHAALLAWSAYGAETGSTAADGWRAELTNFISPHVPGLLERASDLWFLLSAATVLVALGLADDWRGLDWRLRLAVQVLVAGVVVFGRDWRLTMFIDWPLLTGLVSVAWIVGLINSFNMLDNMDGLCAGVAAIAAAILAAVMLIAPDPLTHQPQLFVAGFLLVLVGALVGFLMHNRPPARLFMGDAGSYFVGFCLAVVTILATFAGGETPRHAILAPLCVLAVPLYDTVTVVWIRLRAGQSPFEGDKNHFSHRLVELGLSPSQAVLTIYLTTAACGLGALLLHQVNAAGAVVILLLIGCLLSVVAILESTARRKRNSRRGH